MIKDKDIYDILVALVPLYVAMILAYGSVRWWKILTPEQCSGISRYVASFSVPMLNLHFISSIDPYHMNWKFLAADTLHKVVTLVALSLWSTFFTKRGGDGLDWIITFFSVTTMPNALLVGIPLLSAMYGEFTTPLMIQLVVLQSVIWCNLLLFLYEYRAAKQCISQQLLENTIESINKVDSNVGSLNVDMVGEGGNLHVGVKSSTSLPMIPSFHTSHLTSGVSNLPKVGIYSISSREPMKKRASSLSFHRTNFYTSSLQNASFEEEILKIHHEKRFWRSKSYTGVHELIDMSSNPKASRDKENVIEDGNKNHLSECKKEVNIKEGIENKIQQVPHARVMTKQVLIIVWRKLIRNPNTHAAFWGFLWALISFRWNIKLPSIISESIEILSKTSLGMSMFSLGLFIALQPKIIACGKTLAAITMAIKFLVGPAMMAATSKVVDLRGVIFQVSIMQAIVPQGVVPFVFAREYNVHAEILSTAIIFGMAASFPISVVYYVLLGL